jgi:hypothetical protein
MEVAVVDYDSDTAVESGNTFCYWCKLQYVFIT